VSCAFGETNRPSWLTLHPWRVRDDWNGVEGNSLGAKRPRWYTSSLSRSFYLTIVTSGNVYSALSQTCKTAKLPTRLALSHFSCAVQVLGASSEVVNLHARLAIDVCHVGGRVFAISAIVLYMSPRKLAREGGGGDFEFSKT